MNNTGAITTSGAITTVANGLINLTASGTETIGAAVAAGGSGTVGLTANGANSDVLINAGVSGGAITVTAGRTITEGGAGAGTISTSGLLTTSSGGAAGAAAGGTSFGNANTVGSFNATNAVTGNVNLVNTAALLTITGITNTAASGNDTVNNTGAITTSGPVVANNGNVDMKSTQLQILTADINAGTGNVYLSSGGAITESTTAKIIATDLGMTAAGAITVNSTTNNVTNVAAATSTGNIQYQDADTVAVKNVASFGNYAANAATTGITTGAGNGNIDVKAGGLMTITNDILAGTGNLNLISAGPVTEAASAKIVANALTVTAAGAITLTTATNDFNSLVFTGGAVNVTDKSNLTLSGTASGNLTTNAVATTFGATTVGGALDMTATGAVTQTGVIKVTGNTLIKSSGAANITLNNFANAFGGSLAMTLGSGTAKVTSSNGFDLGTSDYGTAAVTLTALGNSRTGSVIKGGMAADASSLSPSTKASFTQSGVLKSAAGGSLLLASPAESDVLLNSQTNDLKGTIATTAQTANPLNNFQVKSNQITMGTGGVTARSAVLWADSVTTPQAINGSIRLVKRGDNSVVLTFKGLTGIGQFGFSTPGQGIYIDTNDYVAVMPNNVVTGASVVYLEGTRDFKPAYEFAADPTYRAIVYNGEAADSPQIRGALSSAIAPLRDTIKEQLSAGFSKENLRKQLTDGVVLQTGVARPGIDKIDGAMESDSCDASPIDLSCVR